MLTLLPALLGVLPSLFPAPGGEDVLDGLRAEHPRLILTRERQAEIEALAETDVLLRKAIQDSLRRADDYLAAQPLRYQKKGPRLLHVSRECLSRVYALGLAWRLTGEERYLEAVRENLLAVCAFPDWNPSHFLDTAEMSHAVGVGYDWCFAALDEPTRAQVRAGLIEHGLEPGLAAYSGPAWWVRSAFNWNQVCNGGLVVGALAIAESDPRFARTIVPAAVESLPRALDTYDPDGAWPEGPGYWSYATHYTVFGLAALDSALGHDFGLSEREGLARSGHFPLAACGPDGTYVTFADVGEGARRKALPALYWLARRYDEPALARAESAWIEKHRAYPLHAIWYVPDGGQEVQEAPLDEHFGGPVELALLRGPRDDPAALFLALKAGYNAVNHGHLDLGNFELDAHGVRWARDLGADDYNLPGYWDGKQGGRRWTYYRLGSHSHNLVTLDGEQQAVAGKARFVAFKYDPQGAHAIVAIDGAWPGRTDRMLRGAALVDDRRAVLIQDEFRLSKACEVTWGLTTDAEIRLEGGRATLEQEGKTLSARVLEPRDASFRVESAERAPPERRNAGVRRLVVRFAAEAGEVRLAVVLAPGEVGEVGELRPLSDW